MWEKDFRIAVFYLVYQILFNEINQVNFSEEKWKNFYADFEYLSSQVINLDKINKQKLDNAVKQFFSNREKYTNIIEENLKDYNKTFVLIKACLFSYLIEKDQLNRENQIFDKDKIISKYLRLTQDFAGNQSVGLVHAVLSKMF